MHIWQVSPQIPAKYEHVFKDLTYTFAKSKFPIIEKLTKWSYVTPTPGK